MAKVLCIRDYIVPVHSISALSPTARLEPKLLKAGRTYDWIQRSSGVLVFYTGRKWYEAPADHFQELPKEA